MCYKEKPQCCRNLVFQEAKKEEEIKVKALIYKDVDLYAANICWKGGGGGINTDSPSQHIFVISLLSSLGQGSNHIQRLQVCQPR